MILALIYVSRESAYIVSILLGFVFLAAIIEILLQKIAKREIRPRITY
jgi:hypothetical protein